MPERRDYILRMIEQMSRVLARVRAMIARGEVVPARDELRAVVRQAGLELDMVTRMSPDTLMNFLTVGGAPDPARCLLVAEVLAAEAERAAVANDGTDVERLRAKAITLYRAARPHIGRDDQEIVDRRIAELGAGSVAARETDRGAMG